MGSRSHDDKFDLGRVIESPLHDLVRSKFLNYAMSVITDRALPDVRDGLKPVQRRILYAMYHDLHLTPDKSTLKCAKVVGQVLGSYHPHGDTAVYEAMARMAQDWVMRYPLVFGQGNFGSVDGDGPAAYRYTEAKLSAAALEFVDDLGNETVDFTPNFDESTLEPKVLPARIPEMLCNGCMGIAVGVATNIPPHNLGELLQACRALVDKRHMETADLLKYIKGPDFPTGGEIISAPEEIKQVYEQGQGPIKMRGTYFVEEAGKRVTRIIINSIPYMVNKAKLVEEFGNIAMSGKIPQLQDVRDESAEEMRICLECRSGSDVNAIMAYLFKNTKLQSAFHVNMTCLTERGPERVNLRGALLDFIDFRFQVTVRRFNHEVRLLNERIHILEGFVKVFDDLEEAIRIIRASTSRSQASLGLQEYFLLDEAQAEAVLELKLYRLGQNDVFLIRNELADKLQRRDQLEALLNDIPGLWGVVKDEFSQLRRRLGDARRTAVLGEAAEEFVYSEQDFITDERTEVIISADGWIRRMPPGSDLSKLRMRQEDYVWLSIETSTLSNMIFFTNLGAAYTIAVHELPSGARGFGEPVQKFFAFSNGERLVAAFAFDPKEEGAWRAEEGEEMPALQGLALSSDGHGLRFSFANFVEASKRSGRRFMRLAEGGEVTAVEAVRGGCSVALVSRRYRALICPASEIGFMAGAARGVQVMKLEEADRLQEVMVLNNAGCGMLFINESTGTLIEVSSRKLKTSARGGKGSFLIKRGSLKLKEKFYGGVPTEAPKDEALLEL